MLFLTQVVPASTIPPLTGAAISQTAVLPAGSMLQVRLTSSVSSATSQAGDVVSAVVTVDAAASGLVLPAGTIIRGVVRQAMAFSWSASQAVLWLDFRELADAGRRVIPIATRVVAVDNARETVDQDGRILGITPPREAPAGSEGAVLLAAMAPELYDLARAEFRFRELERPDIVYAAGTDFVLEALTATRDVPAVAARADAMPDRELLAIASAQPLRTSAGTPPRPADVINLVFSASEIALQHAFNTAGWNTAVALGLRADVKTGTRRGRGPRLQARARLPAIAERSSARPRVSEADQYVRPAPSHSHLAGAGSVPGSARVGGERDPRHRYQVRA